MPICGVAVCTELGRVARGRKLGNTSGSSMHLLSFPLQFLGTRKRIGKAEEWSLECGRCSANVSSVKNDISHIHILRRQGVSVKQSGRPSLGLVSISVLGQQEAYWEHFCVSLGHGPGHGELGLQWKVGICIFPRA